MGFLKYIKDTFVKDKNYSEAIYASALREIESGIRRDGLFAKAIASAEGNIDIAKSHYIKLLVKALEDEKISQHQGSIEKHRQETLRIQSAIDEQITQKNNIKLTNYHEQVAEINRTSRNWSILITISYLIIVYFVYPSLAFTTAIPFAIATYFMLSGIKLLGITRPGSQELHYSSMFAIAMIIFIVVCGLIVISTRQ